MATTIEEILQNTPKLVTAHLKMSVADALNLMFENEFSQLPVIDDQEHQQGIVTAESILRSQRNFSTSLDDLLVRHALINAATALPRDDIFEVFEKFEKHSAVLIVDNDNRLNGIITPWDTAAYLQQRTEDMMLVEDIESTLKEHIEAAFTDPTSGRLEQAKLDAAIQRMVDNTEENYSTIESSLKEYIGRNGIKHSPTRGAIEESFKKAIVSSESEKSFEDLSFYHYMELFLHQNHWSTYGKRFGLKANSIRSLLDSVRQIRNKLAHFRGDIQKEERDKLRFCRDWLERNPTPNFAQQLQTTDTSLDDEQISELDLTPTDEEPGPTDSRYAKLAIYLQQTSMSKSKRVLSFIEIEEILQGSLPTSAREHRSWWANDSVSHVQSQQWLDAGWRVASVNMSEEIVTFTRNKEREEMYIDFFSQLLNELQEKDFPLRDVNPIGTNWIYVHTLPSGRSGSDALYSFTFARGGKFRVEIYIDTKDKENNQQIFNTLYEQKTEIEAEIGESLSWESLDTKRACRIAIYRDGSITDKKEEWDKLITWAIPKMIAMENTFSDRTEQALAKIL